METYSPRRISVKIGKPEKQPTKQVAKCQMLLEAVQKLRRDQRLPVRDFGSANVMRGLVASINRGLSNCKIHCELVYPYTVAYLTMERPNHRRM